MATNWTRPDTRFLIDEIGLFVRPLSSLSRDPWKTRLDRWKVHIDVLATIRVDGDVRTLQKGQAERLMALKGERIAALKEHLDILDNKIGTLLNLNTLMLIGVNVLLGVVFNVVAKPLSPTATLYLLGGSVGIFVLFWVGTTVICLVGARRVVWGDLWRTFTGELDAITQTQLVTAEEEHVSALIVTVARRTNKFRIGNLLLTLNAGVMCLCLALSVVLVVQSHRQSQKQLQEQEQLQKQLQEQLQVRL